MSLFWRVFVINAGLLVAAAIALALSPATVSAPIDLVEAGILAAGLLLLLGADYLLLRRTFGSLERLSRTMRSVDLLRPGRRLPVTGGAEVAGLVTSFNEMLDRLETERRESNARALAAQEGERARVAAELHDEVGQAMTGVLLLLERVSNGLPPESRGALVDAQEAVRASLDDVRRIARELRPELLEHLGLVSALKALADGLSQRTGLEIERRFAPGLPDLPADRELVVFRVAQESLTNAVRHAGASKVLLSLEPGRESLVLRVVDDGRGLNGSQADGGGLRGMRERAVIVGAALAVKRSEAGGVEVRLEVPTGAVA